MIYSCSQTQFFLGSQNIMHLNNFVGEYNLNFFFVCLEINECTVNPDICGAGHCVNLPVGYTCICYEGYRLNDQQTKCSGMNGCFQESEITMLWNVWNVDSNQEGYATEQSGAASSTRCFQTTQKRVLVCQMKFASLSLIRLFTTQNWM